jgi:hypothetical protein
MCFLVILIPPADGAPVHANTEYRKPSNCHPGHTSTTSTSTAAHTREILIYLRGMSAQMPEIMLQ